MGAQRKQGIRQQSSGQLSAAGVGTGLALPKEGAASSAPTVLIADRSARFLEEVGDTCQVHAGIDPDVRAVGACVGDVMQPNLSGDG